jgi:hypothetical protein
MLANRLIFRRIKSNFTRKERTCMSIAYFIYEVLIRKSADCGGSDLPSRSAPVDI